MSWILIFFFLITYRPSGFKIITLFISPIAPNWTSDWPMLNDKVPTRLSSIQKYSRYASVISKFWAREEEGRKKSISGGARKKKKFTY